MADQAPLIQQGDTGAGPGGPEALPYPDREELAWAAGFYDGEGCTGFTSDKRGNRTNTIRMGVKQVRREPLERFQNAVLGLGKIYGPYKKSAGENGSPIHAWMATSWEAQAVYALLWPFLAAPKREQIQESVVKWQS